MDKNVNVNENINNAVPYIAFEGVCSRLERNNRRLFVLCIVLIVALIASNVAWVFYEMQYQDVTVTQEVEQDADEDGENTFVGGDYNTNEDGSNG